MVGFPAGPVQALVLPRWDFLLAAGTEVATQAHSPNSWDWNWSPQVALRHPLQHAVFHRRYESEEPEGTALAR